MKNSNIRILVVLSILTLLGVVSTQIYWFNRSVDQQDQVFNHNVQVALRNVVESLCEANGTNIPLDNPIEQVTGNYFIVKTNNRIDLKTLDYLITAEIRERAIVEDFEYGVYDCQNDKMVYSENVNFIADGGKEFPELTEENYYFGVYFPDKSKQLMGQLDLWKFTTVLTVVLLLFFGYSLWVILKQKRLSEIQKDFINNVTHELKTPISTLQLATETLAEKYPLDSKYIEVMSKEVGRLQNHVDQILTGSILDEKTSVNYQQVNLRFFVDDIVSKLKNRSNNIVWDIEIDNVECKINPELVDIILTNLLDNALKYGGDRIEVYGTLNRKEIEISVRDHGPGISSEHQRKIFDRFYRVPEDQERHTIKGFGLGLFIVKKSLKKLGGKIEIDSKIGKGSTFKITIPNG